MLPVNTGPNKPEALNLKPQKRKSPSPQLKHLEPKPTSPKLTLLIVNDPEPEALQAACYLLQASIMKTFEASRGLIHL